MENLFLLIPSRSNLFELIFSWFSSIFSWLESKSKISAIFSYVFNEIWTEHEAVIRELSEYPSSSFAQNKNPSESAKAKIELYIDCNSFLYLTK